MNQPSDPLLRIQLNGEDHELERGLTLEDLLGRLAISGRFAVEVNGLIVPRSRFREYHLQAADAVEIVKAIGGG